MFAKNNRMVERKPEINTFKWTWKNKACRCWLQWKNRWVKRRKKTRRENRNKTLTNIYIYMCSSLLPRRHAGLSSLVGIQIFWILFWVSSLGIPWRLAKEAKRKRGKTALYPRTQRNTRFSSVPTSGHRPKGEKPMCCCCCVRKVCRASWAD